MMERERSTIDATQDMPDGWTPCRLPDIADLVMGQSPPGKTYNDGGKGLPFFQGKTDFRERHPVVRKWCSAPTKIAEPGDVLMSIRAPVGPTNVADQTCAIGRGVAAIRPTEATSTELLLFALRLQEQSLAQQGTGSTFTAINRDHLDAIEIKLPPLAEQKRIVAKVEELLGRVNAARARLAKAPAILKRFRQSVLAAACSGQLTADWRDANLKGSTANDEAAQLEEERVSLWSETARAKAKAEDRLLSGTSWRSRYSRPIDVDPSDLPEIPASWRWASFDSFAASFQYGPRFGEGEYVASGGVPTVRTSDMDFRGHITLDNPPHVMVPAGALDHFALQPNDLLVTRTGATIGKCALFDPGLGPAIASAYLIRYRLPRQTACPRFLLAVFMSPWGQQYLVGGTTAVAQPNVNTKTIAAIPVPVPPLAEQQEIVRRVEALFALADKIEARVQAAAARVEKITQAILAKAFRGELVPTEAELARAEGRPYEPAAALLARIRAKRAAEHAPVGSHVAGKRERHLRRSPKPG